MTRTEAILQDRHQGAYSKATSFTDTRARITDGQTSKDAAKNAASERANFIRARICSALQNRGPLTAREIANLTRIDYYAVQRRISETFGIVKTAERRDGGFVWRAV